MMTSPANCPVTQSATLHEALESFLEEELRRARLFEDHFEAWAAGRVVNISWGACGNQTWLAGKSPI